MVRFRVFDDGFENLFLFVFWFCFFLFGIIYRFYVEIRLLLVVLDLILVTLFVVLEFSGGKKKKRILGMNF